MTKLLSALTIVSLSAPAAFGATECPTDAAEVEAMISRASTCFDAATIARDCAWGTLVDLGLTGAATKVCERDYAQMSQADKRTMAAMRAACDRRFRNEEGTMYRSMSAHCNLNVSEFWSNIYGPLN